MITAIPGPSVIISIHLYPIIGSTSMHSNECDEWSEEDEDEELDDLALVAATASVLGAEEARLTRAERRKPSRRYLRRPQLLPNPRYNTPWQVLLASRDDRAFITTMGLDCATFDYILSNGFAERWNNNPIPRPDADAQGLPRLGGRSLDAEGALGLIYHFLTSAMSDTALQQIFALVPATVARYRVFALSILLETLRALPESSIRWWDSREECEGDNSLILERHPLLEGAIGSIDGLNIAIATSDDPDLENATYNGWLHGHFTSCVLVFSPRGVCSILSTIKYTIQGMNTADSLQVQSSPAFSTPRAAGTMRRLHALSTTSSETTRLKASFLLQTLRSLGAPTPLQVTFKLPSRVVSDFPPIQLIRLHFSPVIVSCSPTARRLSGGCAGCDRRMGACGYHWTPTIPTAEATS